MAKGKVEQVCPRCGDSRMVSRHRDTLCPPCGRKVAWETRKGKPMKNKNYYLSKEGKRYCPGCEEERNVDDFNKSKRNALGRRSYCRDCEARRDGERKEEYRERVMAYRERTRGAAAKRTAKWVAEHPEQHARNRKRFRELNKDKIAEYQRRYRAKAGDIDGGFSADMESFARAFWGHECAVCGSAEKLHGKRLPLDHWRPKTPRGESHGTPLSIGNAVLLCWKCNGKKHNMSGSEAFGEETAFRIESKIEELIVLWEQANDAFIGLR